MTVMWRRVFLVALLATLITMASAMHRTQASQELDEKALVDFLANAPDVAAEDEEMRKEEEADQMRFQELDLNVKRPPGSDNKNVRIVEAEDALPSSDYHDRLVKIRAKMKKLAAAIGEDMKLAEMRYEKSAELRGIDEELNGLEREKEKIILEGKLKVELDDLAKIEDMSQSLRHHFKELVDTQEAIKSKMTGAGDEVKLLDEERDVQAKADRDQLAADMDNQEATAHLNIARMLGKEQQEEIHTGL